jgi:hypothetical protein
MKVDVVSLSYVRIYFRVCELIVVFNARKFAKYKCS